jgi:hypothetical protein
MVGGGKLNSDSVSIGPHIFNPSLHDFNPIGCRTAEIQQATTFLKAGAEGFSLATRLANIL